MPDERRVGSARGSVAEIDALKEAVRVMLGFQTLEELQDLLERQLVRDAMMNLEKALELTRARHQPDEFALATAVEIELLEQAKKAGQDLEELFNNPEHHEPPSTEIASLVERIWPGGK